MSDFEIFETEQFEADLRNLARAGQARLIKKLRTVVYPQIKARPHFGPNIKKLKEYTPDTWRFRIGAWRFRIGAWRFFYEIDEENRRVWMIAAAHRGVAY